MIKKTVVSLLVLGLSACLGKQNTVTEESSESGLAYTLVYMPNNTNITIQISWPNTWVDGPKRNQAVPYIGAEVLFSGGAEGYPVGELAGRFGEIGSEAFLSVTPDHIQGTVHFSPEHQVESIKTANAHLRHPSLDEQWVEQAREQLAVQLSNVSSSAEARGFDALRWALFGNQTIREALSLDGESGVAAVTQAQLATWAKSVFKRKGAIITIAGDLSATEAGLAIDALFEGLPAGDNVAVEPVTADFSPRRILVHVPGSVTSTLSFIGKLPPLTEFEELEDLLLTVAMTEHWKNGLSGITDNKATAGYRFTADFSAFGFDHRFILLSGQVQTSEVADAEKQLRNAYNEFRAELPIKDLQELKATYAEDFKKYMNNSGSMSNSALMAKLNGMDPARSLDFLDKLDSVKKKTLSRRLQTAFPNADDFIVLVSSPDKTALPDACVIKTPIQALGC